jgi:hypothetical protein
MCVWLLGVSVSGGGGGIARECSVLVSTYHAHNPLRAYADPPPPPPPPPTGG